MEATDPELQDREDSLQLMSSKWFQAPPDMLAAVNQQDNLHLNYIIFYYVYYVNTLLYVYCM